MSLLNLSSTAPADVAADALVIPTLATDSGADLLPGADLPGESAAHLRGILAALSATGRVDEVHVVAMTPGITAAKVALSGITPKATAAAALVEPTADSIRMGVGGALRTLGTVGTVAVVVPDDQLDAAAQGAALGSYVFTAHKSAQAQEKPAGRSKSKAAAVGAQPRTQAESVTLLVPDAKDRSAKAALSRAGTIAAATAYARDLVNTPPNLLFPDSFAQSVQAKVAASSAKLEVVIHDEEKLTQLGCGGIVGVGQGSFRPPRIVEVHYRPRRKSAPVVAFVGKGITFDTGGVCIKPAASMLTMKCDMAGAAAAAAAVIAAAELGVEVGVSAYLCLAENMPGGNAQRPGDIVSMRSGTTVEIIDTDAEGRMVLADGITLAAEAGAAAIIDIATLTGACMVALGTKVAGVMSNDEDLSAAVLRSARDAGEPMWPLPLPEDLRGKLDSAVADLQHKGDQYGGALTAGLFLREFAKDSEGTAVPWAHLDIAGPAFLTEPPFGHVSKGGTGYAVATLVDLVAGWGKE